MQLVQRFSHLMPIPTIAPTPSELPAPGRPIWVLSDVHMVSVQIRVGWDVLAAAYNIDIACLNLPSPCWIKYGQNFPVLAKLMLYNPPFRHAGDEMEPLVR